MVNDVEEIKPKVEMYRFDITLKLMYNKNV